MDNAGNAGFQPLDFGFVRRGMYNHIQTSQLVGPAADILEYNAIGRLGFSPRIRRHEYHAVHVRVASAAATRAAHSDGRRILIEADEAGHSPFRPTAWKPRLYSSTTLLRKHKTSAGVFSPL
jgi:hypothetical protein